MESAEMQNLIQSVARSTLKACSNPEEIAAVSKGLTEPSTAVIDLQSINSAEVINASRAASPSYAELQMALAAALVRESGLRSQLHDLDKGTHSIDLDTPSTRKCHFLEIIPLEVRNMIYDLLLRNDELASFESIVPLPDHWDSPSTPAHYCLSPFVLQTCAQIHNEAIDILYQRNKFVVRIKEADMSVLSPLNRKFSNFNPNWGHSTISFTSELKLMTSSKLFSRIKHWKVFVEPGPGRRTSAPPAFFDFCKTVCKLPLISLNVVFTYGRDWDGVWQTSPSLYMDGQQLSASLRPLTMLRKIPAFELFETVEKINADYAILGQTRFGDEFTMLKNDLEAEVRGESPGIHVFEMYEKLLVYAQAFERNQAYKLEMRSTFGEESRRMIVARKYFHSDFLDHVELETIHPDVFKLIDPEIARFSHRWEFEKFKSPFKTGIYHPVEGALAQASIAVEMNNYQIFKLARQQALDYLEPQYGRIMSASLAMTEMIKEYKRAGRLFGKCDERHNIDTPLIAQIMVVVDNYAKSFIRDTPPWTIVSIRTRQREFELSCAFHDRESSMLKIQYLTEQIGNSRNVDSFMQLTSAIQAVIDDMDDQMLQIREARKALFEFDVVGEDLGCDIEVEEWRCDEKIQWDAHEPVIGCKNYNDW